MTEFNPEAYDTFWYWINERHRIFLKKETGRPKPWTKDQVLQEWKFCNPFRKNDKQTRLLNKNVILPHWNKDPGMMFFNIYAFRAFNWWPTYHYLVDSISPSADWINRWEPDDVVDLLEHRTKIGNQQLTSGAYMIRGREGMPKYESIVLTLDHVWRQRRTLAYILQDINTLEEAHHLLMDAGFWGWGRFCTYQVVLDLLDSPILESATDVNTWCEFGPGAIRGLRCIWPHLPSSEWLGHTQHMLAQAPHFLEQHVPKMNLQDIEFSLCELSKYLRIKNGGHGKEGYKGYAGS